MHAPRKPTPDELLLSLQEEEESSVRGRLKIFLGYASGVGKSFRMFDEGRRRRDRGQDVVVGATQPRNTPELVALIQQLEILPLSMIGGEPLVDTVNILKRHPQVCLVDGLSQENPPGAKNAHRWQDVEQLLSAGISVITTVNLEFVAELQQQVSEIRGKTASSSVPEAFIQKADEVVVVDAPANFHVNWLKSTYINAPLSVKEKKLSQLREIALLLAADVVDYQLDGYLRRQGIASSGGAQEKFMVCLTPKAPVPRMLERARFACQRFHGELFAVHVRAKVLTSDEQKALDAYLQLAVEAEAEVVLLDGDDEVSTLVDFARKERVTQIYIGHSPARSWYARLAGTTADRLIHATEGMDVKLFPT